MVNVADLLGLPCLDTDLERVEVALQREAATEDPFLAEVTTHLSAAGGKRLRPLLTLAAAASSEKEATEEVLLGSVAVELVHIASLYHDDVMDEAEHRRQVLSVNARWGNLVAVVAGDFLLARAAGIAASLGTEVASLLAATLGRMCEGQVAEVHAAFDAERPEPSYLNAIAGKTASLMACSCRIGALTSGLDGYARDALTEFGEALGMVFQIRDDILDVVASDEELGKEAGQDLVKGIYTLPVLRALADPEAGPELRSILGRPLGDADRALARSVIAGSGAIAEATAEARRWADRAHGAASALPPSPAGEALARLPHALLDTLAVPTL